MKALKIGPTVKKAGSAAMLDSFDDTDKELWRKAYDDAFSPRVFVTDTGSIGMTVQGRTIVMPVEHWHELALKCT